MIDRAALLEKLEGLSDRIVCRDHPEEPAQDLCESCRAPLCEACLLHGALCGACGPVTHPGLLTRTLRWVLTPIGGAITSILLLTAFTAAFRDREPPHRTALPERESLEWRTAMAMIEKAWRLCEAADVLREQGEGGRAKRRFVKAAQLYREATRIYPDNEVVATRAFTVARLRLAVAACTGGDEAETILEGLMKEHDGGPVGVLARLRWAAAAKHRGAPGVLRVLETAVKQIETRVVRVPEHSKHEESKRREIVQLTRTEIDWTEALAEAHYRLGEGHFAAGSRNTALEYFKRTLGFSEWSKKASERAAELRRQSPGSTKPEFRIERLKTTP